MTKNNFFALHWLQVYWHINHIRRCDTLWNNITNIRINEISTQNYRYMLQHKLYHRSNQKFDSTNWSLNTWTKTYHSWCRHQNTVWRHTGSFQTNVHMFKLGFHATFRAKNTFFPNNLHSNDISATGQSISQRGWAIAKSKILQQFSKPLHYQLCPAIGIPHIMCQSCYQLSQLVCLKKKIPKEVHQITSNTHPTFLIPCGNNQWTVLDQLTPSKDDVWDLCLVFVTVVGVLGNEGTLERWLL